MRRRARSMTSCIASGSRRSASREESTMSPKSTVTCLRSPSRAAFDVKMRSARCLGVYASGPPKHCEADGPAWPAGWAHSEQNLAVAESWAPQFAHTRASGAAHSSQNFAPVLFSCWHRAHFIVSLGIPRNSMAESVTELAAEDDVLVRITRSPAANALRPHLRAAEKARRMVPKEA